MAMLNSADITSFVRWFPLVLFIVMGLVALYQAVAQNSIEGAVAAAGSGFAVSVLWFFSYSRKLWSVMVDDGRIILKKPGKTQETHIDNIRRIEVFPDILFRGQKPQYELIFREQVEGFDSVRFYPNLAGEKWLNELKSKTGKPIGQRRR
jgi:hypothetical protein